MSKFTQNFSLTAATPGLLPELNAGPYVLYSSSTDVNGNVIPYSYTAPSPAPVYNITQWSIDTQLSNWVAQGNGTFKASSNEGNITVGNNQIVINQNGTFLTCTNSGGQPREFDLFFSPMSMAPIPLDTSKTITFYFDVDVAFAKAGATTSCNPSWAGMGLGLTLSTTTTPVQTLFYTYHLRNAGLDNTTGVIGPNWPSSSVIWYATTNPYGVDDFPSNLSGFTTGFLTMNFNIDILPRIKAALAAAPTVPQAAWAITGVYSAQSIWGNMTNNATWRTLQVRKT